MRLRRPKSDPINGTAPPEVMLVGCVFCMELITYTDRDPVALGIVNGWRPTKESPDETLYAHRTCLLSRVHPRLTDVSDEGGS